jgi:hypothetical protein
MYVAAARWAGRAIADGGDFLIGFWYGREQAANVVVQFIRLEAVRVHPGSRFDSRDLQARARHRQHGNTTGGAQADNRDVNRLKIDGHCSLPKPTGDTA